jgi:hypothetical protein
LKDVAESRKDVVESVETCKAGALKSLVAKLVIDVPLIRIPKDFIRLSSFLEVVFGLSIPGIAIGMVLESQLTVSFFYVICGGSLVDPQDLIVVSLYHQCAFLLSF